MADVQPENGYTMIAHELLEAIYKTPMSDYEHRVLMLIIRKTYGFHKKEDWISLSQAASETEIRLSHVCRTINKLLNRNMIKKENKLVSVQKDYEQWVTQTGNLPKQVTLPKQVIEVTQTGNKKLPKQGDTKDNKDTSTKESIYTDILTYWNNKNIIIHRTSDLIKKQIERSLKRYTKEEIFLAIDNYDTVLKDDDYYFDYRWTLEEFLKRRNALSYFLNDGQHWVNYQEDKGKQKPKKENYTRTGKYDGSIVWAEDKGEDK